MKNLISVFALFLLGVNFAQDNSVTVNSDSTQRVYFGGATHETKLVSIARVKRYKRLRVKAIDSCVYDVIGFRISLMDRGTLYDFSVIGNELDSTALKIMSKIRGPADILIYAIEARSNCQEASVFLKEIGFKIK